MATASPDTVCDHINRRVADVITGPRRQQGRRELKDGDDQVRRPARRDDLAQQPVARRRRGVPRGAVRDAAAGQPPVHAADDAVDVDRGQGGGQAPARLPADAAGHIKQDRGAAADASVEVRVPQGHLPVPEEPKRGLSSYERLCSYQRSVLCRDLKLSP